ncbi:hypothetical protein EES46_14785 [Streptomyces sp. ADI98-10]|nr:hypothetical protein EES46_14785 [Streptomyces sp. ADI98-10]
MAARGRDGRASTAYGFMIGPGGGSGISGNRWTPPHAGAEGGPAAPPVPVPGPRTGCSRTFTSRCASPCAGAAPGQRHSVRVRECGQHLVRDRERRPGRHPAPVPGGQPLQAAARAVLAGEPELLVQVDPAAERHDVGMVQGADALQLAGQREAGGLVHRAADQELLERDELRASPLSRPLVNPAGYELGPYREYVLYGPSSFVPCGAVRRERSPRPVRGTACRSPAGRRPHGPGTA